MVMDYKEGNTDLEKRTNKKKRIKGDSWGRATITLIQEITLVYGLHANALRSLAS